MTKHPQNRKPASHAKKPLFFILPAVLILLTSAAYWQVSKCDFVSFDDFTYVQKNPNIQSGLNINSIKWAFTTTYAANWHPLTWLSLMLDYELYGLKAGGFHITNLIFHLANTVLLFWLFLRMTKSLWPSAFIAALFALHPLHVESVAWVAERKDVLSTFFWFLTMLAYLRYTESKTKSRYLTVVILFILGLMAKPMLVTLPFVLLLMDYWPLNRLNKNAIIEKLPLLGLAALSSIITMFAQKTGGAMVETQLLAPSLRFANIFVSYITYISKTLWPTNLAVLYLHPLDGLKFWQVAGSAALLIGITLLAISSKRKWFVAGWLWFLVTLIPVIGLVQVGNQAFADRYMYVPMIGLSIIFAFAAKDFVTFRHKKAVFACCSAVLFAALSICTVRQVSVWQNSITLYEHTTAVTTDNYLAYVNLSAELIEQGKLAQAEENLRKAIAIEPRDEAAQNNLATVLLRQGKPDEAKAHLLNVLKTMPNCAEAYVNLGNISASQKNLEEAIRCYQKALQLKPDLYPAQFNLEKATKELEQSNSPQNR